MEAAPLFETEGVAPPPGGAAEWLRAEDGVRLRLALWPGGARGLVLVAPGRTEFIEKHYETIERLQARGFAVAALDWRGQGLSDRPLPDRRRGHVGDFAEFQRDVDAARARLARRFADRPWLLFSHSMGGCISARALMRQDQAAAAGEAWAPPFRAASFSAPMLGLVNLSSGFGPARLLIGALTALGLGAGYTPGGGPLTLGEKGFANNPLTTDRGRFERFARISAAHDELVIAGATWGWLHAALREMAEIRPSATPSYVSIGRQDAVVRCDVAKAYAEATPGGRFAELDGALHEPLLETDEIQAVFWAGFDAFIAEQGF